MSEEEQEKQALEILENTRQAWARIVNRYIKKLQKENKELKETLKCTQNSWFEDTKIIEEAKKQLDLDYVSKDKIKELIKEYKPNQSNTFIKSQENYINLIQKIEELLEE